MNCTIHFDKEKSEGYVRFTNCAVVSSISYEKGNTVVEIETSQDGMVVGLRLPNLSRQSWLEAAGVLYTAYENLDK